MWTLDPIEIAGLRDGTGRPFTAFMDALLRSHSAVVGIAEAAVRTCLRTNLPDGGVDTEVAAAAEADETGFLLAKTCWQYKARRYADLTVTELVSELKKEYAAQLIQEGYAYRLAVCDDVPAPTRRQWETELTLGARQIDAEAPEVLIVTTSQLSAWANRYPPIDPPRRPRRRAC
jgi:hypothetical protein